MRKEGFILYQTLVLVMLCLVSLNGLFYWYYLNSCLTLKERQYLDVYTAPLQKVSQEEVIPGLNITWYKQVGTTCSLVYPCVGIP